MSKDEQETPAEEPKKSTKKLMIIVIAVVLVLGGGGGAYFMFFAPKGDAKPEKPVKGAVVTMDEALTINLADGHYLKMGFTMQATEEAGAEAIDNSEAIDLAIVGYTGMEVAELESEKGRAKAKQELLEKIEKVYNVDDKHIIMDIYFTQFVTQ
jgi:flagellar protein FliL